MNEMYAVTFRHRNGRKNNIDHWMFADFDSALKAAKWASSKGADMVCIWHRPTEKLICYCVDGVVA